MAGVDDANEKKYVYQYRVTDKPNSVLWMLTKYKNVHDAEKSLRNRFGEKLIDVKKYITESV